ncbi:uncharacterized protein NPIL_246512 [Nephila pilipes]|uniref:Uncharacterized protein n=1 Tax=Nephila pilipes TaxID=299642 RepID=A0A8X6Q5V7_NEPPI|nr:uncharacterized protein NPIL_246512 [Nephila pilipes]
MDSKENLTNVEDAEVECEVSDRNYLKLPEIPGNVTNIAMCVEYPLLAVASDTGFVNVYELKSEEFLCNYSYPYSATSVIWSDSKLDGIGASIIVGFEDGTLHWLNLVKELIKHKQKINIQKEGPEVQMQKDESEVLENLTVDKAQSEEYVSIQKQNNDQVNLDPNLDDIQSRNDVIEEIEVDEVYDLILRAITKPHVGAAFCLSINRNSSILVSQGMDSKLFFFQLKDFTFIPLGFYLNNHQVDYFGWLNYANNSEFNEEMERLLIFCKHSYILEIGIPNVIFYKEIGDTRKSFCIEQDNCQVYKINGLLQFHELGDKISDIDLEETSEIGREILQKLKYREKKEKREAREQELGISGHITPPRILCCLPSTVPGRMWLSLGKSDSGYLFEFEFIKEFQDQPIDFIPLRALEIVSSDMVSILSMSFSSCGKILLMGLEDRTLHVCHLHEPFDPSSGFNFKKIDAYESTLNIVDCVYVSSDGRFQNIILSSVQRSGQKSFEKLKPNNFLEILSLEEALQLELSKKYKESKKKIMLILEKLKSKYVSFKEEYDAFLEECRVGLKKIQNIPEHLKLNIEVVSRCPTAVRLFEEKTKTLQRDLDKKFERDLVTVSLTKQKYFDCFKSRIECEMFSVENGEKLQSYRECRFPSCLTYSHENPFQVYGVKVEKKENPQDQLDKKSEKNKRNKTIDELKQRLSSVIKDIIDYPENGAASDIVLKYNKRKLELSERLRARIVAEEALESIVLDEETYKKTKEEIAEHIYRLKDEGYYNYAYPTLKNTFTKQQEETVSYLLMVQHFWKLFNSYVNDVQRLKDSDDNSQDKNFINEQTYVPPLKTVDLKKIHISNMRKSENLPEKRYVKIDWNAKGTEKCAEPDESRKYQNKIISIKKEWIQRKFRNFHKLLRAAKPKIDCEKKFYEIRFLMKCIELNCWKSTLFEEKLSIKILSELEQVLAAEKNDISVIEEEISSLKSLRQLEKSKWINLYHDLLKIIGRNHKHKGYFKQVFKKKLFQKEDKKSHLRNSSSESSESEQNIDSPDDYKNIKLLEVDKCLLEKVMDLRLKRQEVEQKMKHYKREIRSAQVKHNAITRKIQKINDTKNETYEKLNGLMENRKQAFDTFKWPLVLYPCNIHSDYLSNKSINSAEPKQLIEFEMSRIHQIISEKLKTVNNYVNVSLLLVTSRVISAEIQDMIDVASVFLSLLDSVSASTDDYFENLELIESLESFNGVHEEKDKEEINALEKILATVKELVPLSKTSLDVVSTESISSDKRTSVESESITSKEAFQKDYFEEVFDLEQMKEEYWNVKEEELHSWHEVYNDMELLGLVDKSHLHFEDINKIFSSAIPCNTRIKTSIRSDSSSIDYYMCPFTYDIPEKIQGREVSFQEETSDTSNDVEETIDHENSLEQEYPTYFQGGLLLNLPVLREMEKRDPESFPYTKFYQDIESKEEIKAVAKIVHIKPSRTLEMQTLYSFNPTPISDFIVVNTQEITHILNFYTTTKASANDLEQQLNLLQNEVVNTKRALSYKQQDLTKVKRELYGAMKSKFFHVIDLEHLQDTLENPHFYIKQAEFRVELDIMKKKLKKMKESEVLTQKALDKLRFEDTQICDELLELRKDFKFLNENYSSKCQVLPKIGSIAKPEEDLQNAEENL